MVESLLHGIPEDSVRKLRHLEESLRSVQRWTLGVQMGHLDEDEAVEPSRGGR